MKRLYMLVMFAVALMAYADDSNNVYEPTDVKIDGIFYKLDTDAKTAIVTRIDAAVYGNNSCLNIPETVKYESDNYAVNEIGEYGTEGYLENVPKTTHYRKITIPSSICKIGVRGVKDATDSLIIEDGASSIKTSFRGYNLYQHTSFGPIITKYIYKGRDVSLSAGSETQPSVRPPYISKDFYVKASRIDIGPEVSWVGVDVEADTANILSGKKPVDNLYIWGSCKTLNVGRDILNYRKSSEAFSAIKSLSFEGDATTVPSGMIRICSYLESLSLSKKINSLKYRELTGHSHLKQINIEDDSPYYSYDNGFLYNGNKSILYVYVDHNNDVFNVIEEANLPASVEAVADSAFYDIYCKIVNAPGLTAVGKAAFYQSRLLELNTSKPIRSIGEYAFYNCSLDTITIDENIGKIEPYSFYGCNSLKVSDNFFRNVKSIGEGAFLFCSSMDNDLYLENIESIGNEAFRDASIKSLRIGEKLSMIPTRAFIWCDLTSVVIPENIKKIEKEAFKGCLLEEVRLEGQECEVGEYAFCENSNLSKVYNASTAPLTIHPNTFCTLDSREPNYEIYDKAILYVPCGSKSKYANDVFGWGFFTNIQEDPSMSSGVDVIVDDVTNSGNAPFEYYDMHGRRVEKPGKGLYIRRQGGESTKVIVK